MRPLARTFPHALSERLSLLSQSLYFCIALEMPAGCVFSLLREQIPPFDTADLFD